MKVSKMSRFSNSYDFRIFIFFTVYFFCIHVFTIMSSMYGNLEIVSLFMYIIVSVFYSEVLPGIKPLIMMNKAPYPLGDSQPRRLSF